MEPYLNDLKHTIEGQWHRCIKGVSISIMWCIAILTLTLVLLRDRYAACGPSASPFPSQQLHYQRLYLCQVALNISLNLQALLLDICGQGLLLSLFYVHYLVFQPGLLMFNVINPLFG